MPCQIGITTNPDRRKQEWQNQRPSLRNWTILEQHRTKTAAQQAENRFARQHGCNSGSGGDGPENANWFVYKFDY